MGTGKSAVPGKRIVYMDMLRILAALGVIVIHVTAQNWGAELHTWDRRILSAYNTMVSWPVNVFVMLSGALFLNPERPLNIRKLYQKNIFRLFAAFLFWSGVYALGKLQSGQDLQDVVRAFLQGRFHLWYLIMAMVLYSTVPIFRKITESRCITEYFLALSGTALFLLPDLVSILRNSSLPYLWVLMDGVDYWAENAGFPFPEKAAFYFVLGSYLHRYELPGLLKKGLPWLGLAALAGQILFSEHYILTAGSAQIPYDLGVLKLLVTAGVYQWGKNAFSGRALSGGSAERIARLLSDNTFGIYLAHILVLYRVMDWLELEGRMAIPAVLFVPVLSLAVMAGSFVVSWLLHCVPVLKKYVV